MAHRLLAVLLVLTVSTAATAAESPFEVIEDRGDRLVVTLPNRLVVIAQRVPTEPVVSVQAWIKTGSIYEQEHVGAGLSHYLEHLLSGGSTTNRTEAENNRLLGQMGAQVNAATSLDAVWYYINTTSEHTQTAVDMMSDWMLNAAWTQEEFDREREVIQSEFAMGDGDPRRIFWKLTQQARYAAHPARHPTIGYIDEFMTITSEELEDFYRRMYVPNNTIFVVVGDIDPREVVTQVAGLWRDAEPRDLPELSFPVEPAIDSPRELSGYADIRRPRMRVAWPGVQMGHDDDYALDLLGSILGQGESSRLVRTVRDQLQLVTSISAFNYSPHWGEGFFSVDADLAAVDDEAVANVRERVLEQVSLLKREPVSEDELRRAKRRVMAAVALRDQTVEGIASRVARDVIATGDPDYLARYAEEVQAVTAEQVREAAVRHLDPSRLITVTLLPTPMHLKPAPLERPEEPDVTFEQLPVDIDNAGLLALLRERTDRGDERPPVMIGPIEHVTLDNGLRVLVQRSTLVPGVAMQMYWLGGLLADEPGREGYANAAATMLMRGTQRRSAEQLSSAIEDLGAQMNTEAGNNTAFITATALSEDWPVVMELMAEVLLEPAFDASEWARLQPRLLASIERQRDAWSGELREHFRAAYYGAHPWSQTALGRADVVAAMTPEDLASYHRQWLAAENAVLVVVGDADTAEVKAKVRALFGDLPSKPAVAFNPPTPQAPEARVVVAPTRKPVAAAQFGFGPGIVRNDADYARLQVLARLMSDFPSGWLEQELRGRGPGLVYAVGAGVQTGLVPGHFTVLFNAQPPTLIEATRRSMQVIERAKTGPIDDADLARAKARVLAGEFFGRQGNSSRAAGLALDELYRVDDPEGERFRAEVTAITADDVKAAARQYLVNPVVVLMTPEPVDPAELEDAVE